MATTLNGYCKHCGEGHILMTICKTEDEANQCATEMCECLGARRERNIKRINERIDDFSTYCEEHKTDLTDEIKILLHKHSMMILDFLILNASITFGRIKAKVSMNSKGNIVLCFSYSDNSKTEV